MKCDLVVLDIPVVVASLLWFDVLINFVGWILMHWGVSGSYLGIENVGGLLLYDIHIGSYCGNILV